MSLFKKEELYQIINRDEKSENIENIKRKEFLNWLNNFTTSIKEELSAVEILNPKEREKRLYRCRYDFEAFRRTYFPHYYTLDGESKLQKHLKKIFLEIESEKEFGKRYAVAAPRGFGKSTDCSLTFPLHIICYQLKHFGVILSDAIELTETLIEAIKIELEENPRLKADFPEVCGIGKVWKVGDIITKNNIRLKGFGSSKRIRGIKHGIYRVDFCIIDDLENDENVKSRKQRDKLEEWLDSSVENLGGVDGKMSIVYIGTLLHRDSLLARKLKLAFWNPAIFRALESYPQNMHLWDEYERLFKYVSEREAHNFYIKNKKEMDRGAKPLWDSVSLEYLMQKRAKSHKAFEKEQQNRPNSENQRFDSSKFKVISKTQMPKFDKTILYTDFKGDSSKNSSDYFGIVAGGINYNLKKLYIFYSNRNRLKGKEAIEFLIKLQKKYNFDVIGGERNGGFYFARDWFKEKCFEEKIRCNTYFIHNSKNKEFRIGELEYPIDDEDIIFVGEHNALFNELDDFPEADHDDVSDCLAGVYALSKIKRKKAKRTRYRKKARYKIDG